MDTYTHMYRASLVAKTIKNLPAMPETWVWSLGWEDPLEMGIATNSSILAWRIPWTEVPGNYSSWDHKELDRTEQLTHTHTHPIFCLSVTQLIDIWTVLNFMAIMSHAAMTITYNILSGYMFSIPLEAELLGHTLNLCFHTLRNCPAVFQSGHTIFHS